MNDIIKTIVGLLEHGRPELQVAAAQVLGELHSKEPAAVKALGAAIRRSPVLGRFCLDALAKIRTTEALQMVAAATAGNDPLAEHAVHLLSDVGVAAHGVLAELQAQVLGDQRVRILTILARHLDKDAITVFVPALLSPETTEAAARLLVAAESQFTPVLQKQLRDGLGKVLGGEVPETCLVHVIHTLAKVDAEGSRAQLLAFTEATSPPAVRAAAFRALRGSKLTAAQVRTMMELLEDQEQKGVHDAVREVLGELPEVPEALLPALKRMLAARQPEPRLFALRMLRTASGSELAKVALKWIDHEDERFRSAAIEALAHNRQAVEPVARLMTATRDPAVSRRCADILIRHGKELPPKFVRDLTEKATRLLGAQPRLADLLLDVALATGGPKIVPVLLERCVRLRRANRHADSLHVLARLASSSLADDEVRYQLGLTKLLHDGLQPASESSPPGNSTMGFFAALVRGGFPLQDRLRKESAVAPEALLRIASHFADAVGVERRFGTDLLQYLAQRTKGRAGDEAKVMLRAVGG
ncbi:MAG: hypothetical protein MUC36_19070 [Planctomycetes bacterium]|jgi:hypothetical protein|nr:hypothetical protein [Planctomycetota bacterium]